MNSRMNPQLTSNPKVSISGGYCWSHRTKAWGDKEKCILTIGHQCSLRKGFIPHSPKDKYFFLWSSLNKEYIGLKGDIVRFVDKETLPSGASHFAWLIRAEELDYRASLERIRMV